DAFVGREHLCDSVGDRFFFASRRRHTRLVSDWSSDVCSSDLRAAERDDHQRRQDQEHEREEELRRRLLRPLLRQLPAVLAHVERSEEHTSELQSLTNLVCRLLLEKKKKNTKIMQKQAPHPSNP